MALSVGVHNHYKRISVMDAMAAEKERLETAILMQAANNSGSFPAMDGKSTISDLNLAQFGKTKNGSEFSSKNNISKPDFARQVEDCELDKSNIVIIGPTGSGKTLLVSRISFRFLSIHILTNC